MEGWVSNMVTDIDPACGFGWGCQVKHGNIAVDGLLVSGAPGLGQASAGEADTSYCGAAQRPGGTAKLSSSLENAQDKQLP